MQTWYAAIFADHCNQAINNDFDTPSQTLSHAHTSTDKCLHSIETCPPYAQYKVWNPLISMSNA